MSFGSIWHSYYTLQLCSKLLYGKLGLSFVQFFILKNILHILMNGQLIKIFFSYIRIFKTFLCRKNSTCSDSQIRWKNIMKILRTKTSNNNTNYSCDISLNMHTICMYIHMYILCLCICRISLAMENLLTRKTARKVSSSTAWENYTEYNAIILYYILFKYYMYFQNVRKILTFEISNFPNHKIHKW